MDELLVCCAVTMERRTKSDTLFFVSLFYFFFGIMPFEWHCGEVKCVWNEMTISKIHIYSVRWRSFRRLAICGQITWYTHIAHCAFALLTFRAMKRNYMVHWIRCGFCPWRCVRISVRDFGVWWNACSNQWRNSSTARSMKMFGFVFIHDGCHPLIQISRLSTKSSIRVERNKFESNFEIVYRDKTRHMIQTKVSNVCSRCQENWYSAIGWIVVCSIRSVRWQKWKWKQTNDLIVVIDLNSSSSEQSD